MEIMLKNKCCLYVIISIRFFSITICNLLIEFPSYNCAFTTFSILSCLLYIDDRSFLVFMKPSSVSSCNILLYEISLHFSLRDPWLSLYRKTQQSPFCAALQASLAFIALPREMYHKTCCVLLSLLQDSHVTEAGF